MLESDRAPEIAAPMPQQLSSVLVVEDDDAMRKAIERLLCAAGFHAVLFPSAEALLESDAANSAGCLVLDIHLPGLSGFELRRRLAALGQNAPVIFITAQDEAATCAEAERLDCIAYFRKPFQGSALLETIRQALKLDPKH